MLLRISILASLLIACGRAGPIQEPKIIQALPDYENGGEFAITSFNGELIPQSSQNSQRRYPSYPPLQEYGAPAYPYPSAVPEIPSTPPPTETPEAPQEIIEEIQTTPNYDIVVPPIPEPHIEIFESSQHSETHHLAGEADTPIEPSKEYGPPQTSTSQQDDLNVIGSGFDALNLKPSEEVVVPSIPPQNTLGLPDASLISDDVSVPDIQKNEVPQVQTFGIPFIPFIPITGINNYFANCQNFTKNFEPTNSHQPYGAYGGLQFPLFG